MMARRAIGMPLLLVAACMQTDEAPDPPDYPACPAAYACTNPKEASFSLLTLRRAGGPDFDSASWRFVLDERECTLAPGGIICSDPDQPREGRATLFVAAEITPGGLGRVFRLDTLARPTSHIRVERDGVLVDEFDHAPSFTRSSDCPGFHFDLVSERLLPSVP